jgi:hypothetical protein
VHLVDDHGRVLDAEYLVEADGGHLALIMESRSGSSSGRAPRNPDYNRTLAILLARLGKLNAVLVDALVDSRHTQELGLPEADRKLIPAPVQLAQEADPEALRRRLGAAQAKIAQAPDATKGGNATKRIRLRVSVPGFQLGDADRLAQALKAPARRSSEEQPGYWWEQEPGENVWMEITRRGDIGADLNAPSAARGGGATASYDLMRLVQPGDVVVHYDARQEAIVGVSVAASLAEPTPVYWVARGSYARRAGEPARWLPGLRIELDRYQQLKPAVTLGEIRLKRDTLLALREQIQVRARGQAIFFPWIPYQDTLRSFQSYLVKMPQQAISLFPQLRAMVNQAEAQPPDLELPPPAKEAEEAVKDAAGKVARRGRAQGFQLDQQAKVAVEAHAMNLATEHYSLGWAVEDVHGRESYDLICRRGDEVKHVEVKGTTTDGAEVILTPNEVRHAQDYPCTALFVVSNIVLERAEDGTVIAAGGKRHCYDPWRLDEEALTPVGFRYQVPASQDSTA